MPAPGTAQPDAMPLVKMRLDGVECIEPAFSLSPSNIVPVGSSFQLRTDLGFEGVLPGANLLGATIRVEHHLQRIEDGTVSALPLTAADTFNIPPEPATMSVLSGPYATGAVAPALTPGTYRVVTHIHAIAPPGAGRVINAFHDGLIIEVVA